MSVTGIIFKCPEAPGRNWNGWLVVIYTDTHSTVFVLHGRNIRAASIGCAVRLDKLDLAELEELRAGNVGPRMLISSSSWEQTPTGNLNAAATPNLRPEHFFFPSSSHVHQSCWCRIYFVFQERPPGLQIVKSRRIATI